MVEDPEEAATTTLHTTVEPEFYELLSKYSSLSKLIRILALWLRYIHNLQHKEERHHGLLSADERLQALKLVVRLSQRAAFSNKISDIAKGKNLRRNSPLLSFTPFLDDDGLLRIGGRLRNAILLYDEKHPYIIAKKCPLATLIVRDVHAATLHGGPELTRSYIMRRF